jgi:hypothetical protein
VDGDGSVLAETSLIFDGGVTTEWIGKTLHRWRRAVRTHQHAMKHALKRSLSRAEAIKSRAVDSLSRELARRGRSRTMSSAVTAAIRPQRAAFAFTPPTSP